MCICKYICIDIGICICVCVYSGLTLIGAMRCDLPLISGVSDL